MLANFRAFFYFLNSYIKVKKREKTKRKLEKCKKRENLSSILLNEVVCKCIHVFVCKSEFLNFLMIM